MTSVARAFRLLGKAIALCALVLWIVPAQSLALAWTRGPGSTATARRFHRAFCAVIGLRVDVVGAPAAAPRALFACNHLSYLDVPALGGIVAATFVAKQDVRGWPLAGLMATLQRTVFVSREARDAMAMTASMRDAFARERRLIVFAEGTTTDGSRVLPFKSSAFAAMTDPALRDVVIQPVSIALLDVDGVPVARGGDRDRYAYHGDATLVPHLFAFLRTSGARLRITFHAPLPRTTDETRKTLAAQAGAVAAEAVSEAEMAHADAPDGPA